MTPQQPKLPSARHRLIQGQYDREARSDADEVERDLLEQRFDRARYTGDMPAVIDVLRERRVIHPAHPEALERHGVDWPLQETFEVAETGDLVRFRKTNEDTEDVDQ